MLFHAERLARAPFASTVKRPVSSVNRSTNKLVSYMLYDAKQIRVGNFQSLRRLSIILLKSRAILAEI